MPGLIIHEAQLTYAKAGFHNVVDLGRWFKDTYDLPLPLGANVLRRDLDPEMASECCRLMRESIQYALDHREEALNYALQFARDMDPRWRRNSWACMSIITPWIAGKSCRRPRRSCSIWAMRQG